MPTLCADRTMAAAAAPAVSVAYHPARCLQFGRHRRFYVSKQKPIPRLATNYWKFRRATVVSSSSSFMVEQEKENDGSMGAEVLHRFIELNLGNWNGSFYQFDGTGSLLQTVTTRLAASSYGEDELMSLIQTLYIKQPASGYEPDLEWAEYKIKESNMFTVDKYQQIGFFPKEKAFALRYQTAGMLETTLRAGVLGEDDIGEESPKGLKIPSKIPSIVCENCLYSQKSDMRARAFHIMDPHGVLEMLLIFLEKREDGTPISSAPGKLLDDSADRITPFLGEWQGHSLTKRTGVYGATITEADTQVILEMNDGRLIQNITSTSDDGTSSVQWTGSISGNLISFDRGFQMIMLPGGMYMACPEDLSKNVSSSQSFHLEFCWMESSDTRQRLVRTFDTDGLAVSSTYFYETKV
ncbi:uncharacterized protein LOC116256982 [Nymphaea colorata]|nr:uncharacterized protein LOC116256982 [Nymphaea colorata]